MAQMFGEGINRNVINMLPCCGSFDAGRLGHINPLENLVP